jgi:amidase
MPEVEQLDLKQLRQEIARKSLSVFEIVSAHLDRITRIDTNLNAFCHVADEMALKRAKEIDKLLASGQNPGPLCGVPISVKDSFLVAGMPATAGLVTEPSTPRTEEAKAVTLLRNSGAVILGKTNVPAGLAGLDCVNPIYGRTLHPLDPNRTPGGSSGGSAVAVATRMVYLDLASDLNGSIRVPASFVGVTGFRPTRGLLPKTGHLPWPSSTAIEPPESASGLIARSVRDLAQIHEALTGDQVKPMAPQRLGVFPLEQLALDSRIEARVEELLNDLPTIIEEWKPAFTLRDLVELAWELARIEISFANRDLEGPTAYRYLHLLDSRARMRNELAQLGMDAYLAPACAVTAPTLDEISSARIAIDSTTVPADEAYSWALSTSGLELPSLTIPTGNIGGLPFGLQIAVLPGNDSRLLSYGLWLEEFLGLVTPGK